MYSRGVFNHQKRNAILSRDSETVLHKPRGSNCKSLPSKSLGTKTKERKSWSMVNKWDQKNNWNTEFCSFQLWFEPIICLVDLKEAEKLKKE